MIRLIRIRDFERGLLFRNGQFDRLLMPGWHWAVSLPYFHQRVEVSSTRDVWLRNDQLDVIVESGALEGEAEVIDLKDSERALVWVDGRFERALGPGLHAVWTSFRDVRIERFDASGLILEHEDLAAILARATEDGVVAGIMVDRGEVALLFRDGQFVQTLQPGRYAHWLNVAQVTALRIDQREQGFDVSGQEIMTADKVTLRLNALVTFRVVDPLAAATKVEAFDQAIYRQAQLALRAVVGGSGLDALLTEKDQVALQLQGELSQRVESLGIEVTSIGIRDVILPGEMKDILNRVTEAKKAAEANLITRREEIAAARSQANTARILESNPTLMRLKELEVLEKVADKANLQVLVGEQGLTDKVVKLV